jgi:hypothetical protein
MAATKDIIAFLLQNYPHKSELSNARVTKMVYLADWRHCIQMQTQLSPIRWVFDNYGPFSWDIKSTAENNPDLFDMEVTHNAFGSEKLLLSMKNQEFLPRLERSEVDALNHVITHTRDLDWQNFIRLVYSTYPILKCPRYAELDLPALATQYQAELALLRQANPVRAAAPPAPNTVVS